MSVLYGCSDCLVTEKTRHIKLARLHDCKMESMITMKWHISIYVITRDRWLPPCWIFHNIREWLSAPTPPPLVFVFSDAHMFSRKTLSSGRVCMKGVQVNSVV